MQIEVKEKGERRPRREMGVRNLTCLFATLVAMGFYWSPLKSLVTFALHDDIYLYSGVIPVLSAALIYLENKRIFSRVRYDWGIGLVLILLAFAIRWGNRMYSSPAVFLSLAILSFIVLWLGVFVLCYGTRTLQAAGFQVSLLVFMVPLPAAALASAVFVMRSCSAWTAGLLFRMGGVPAFQNGFRFSLPGLDVEVAEQCSGIRSALSFLVTSLLVGHLFLRSSWGKLGLVLAAFPITVLKNGLRIVTIYGLSIHPRMEPVTLWVHRYGGIPFSFLGLVLLTTMVTALRKFEEASLADSRSARGGATIGDGAVHPALIT